jgi:hypothetical protein
MPLAIRRLAAVATALLASVILTPGSGGAQTPPQFVNKTSETLTFGGYVQTRWQYTTLDNAVPSNTFRIRRARLKLQAAVNPMVKPTLELDIVPGGVVLKDVFIDYLLSPKGYFTVRAGHWKKPFGREELRSSSALLLVDRGRMSDAFGPSALAYEERDLGVAVLGDLYEARIPVEYSVGVFNGNGANQAQDTDSQKSLVGRLEVIPLPGLSLGANLNLNRLGVNQARGAKDTLAYPGNEATFTAKAFGVDAKFQKRALVIEAEYRSGDNWKGSALPAASSANVKGKTSVNDQAKVRGGYVTAVYKVATGLPRLPAVEPGLRLETYDPNHKVKKDGSFLYTPYLGLYLNEAANTRVQINAVVDKPQADGAKTVTTYVAQLMTRY